MSDDGGRPFWRSDNPIIWGFVFTLSLAAIVLTLGLQEGPSGIARYREFGDLPSNAVGDTLAGIFAPLAFIWIVVTVFLQGQELSEQRKELSLTREELRLAREAQEAQLAVMQKQADIFEDEKKHRDSENARKVFDRLISEVALQALNENELSNNFDLKPRYELDLTSPNPLGQSKGNSDEEVVRSISRSLSEFRLRTMDAFGNVNRQNVLRKSKNHFYYRYLKGDLEYILSLRDRLSEDQEVRMQSLGIEESARILELLLNADLWEHDKDKLA